MKNKQNKPTYIVNANKVTKLKYCTDSIYMFTSARVLRIEVRWAVAY